MPDVTSIVDDSGNTALFDSNGNFLGYDAGIGSSLDASSFGNTGITTGPIYNPQDVGFSPSNQPVDPNNTGDTGGTQNVSTPAVASKNNPETAGASSLGGIISSALNTSFAAWQLASQPAGTTKTVTTKVGSTMVTSGSTGIAGLLGSTSASTNSLLILGVLVLLGIYLYNKAG